MNLKHLFFIFFIPLCCIGQSDIKIDSLKRLIETSKEFYDQGKSDSSYHYAKISYNLAKVLKQDSLQIKIVGILSHYEPDLEKALSYLKESEKIAIKNKLWKQLENIYYSRGSVYYMRTKDGSALKHFLKLDSLLELRQLDKFLAAMTKVKIVEILHESSTANDTSYFPQMAQNIKDGLKIVEDGLKVNKDSLNFYNAWYLNIPAAILYEKSAFLNTKRNKTQLAITDYKKALKNTVFNDTLFEDNYLRKSLIYNGLANLYNKEQQQDSALYFYKKELIEINKTTDILKQAIANYKIADFFNTNDNPKTALKHLNTAKSLMQNAHFVREENKYDIENILASTYFNLGNFEKAYEASEKARRLLIAIQSEFNKGNVSELETKYQTEKKEQAITLLKSEKTLIEQKRKSQLNILLAGLSITTVAGIFLYILFRNRKKTNTKLKELDKLKSNFFANISHEFRTPLTLISNPIETALEDDNLSEINRQQFEMAKRNSNRLLSLVNQLLDLSKIDAGQLRLQIQKNNALQCISTISDAFTYLAKQKAISYMLSIKSHSEDIYFDRDALEKIVINLISNAIKYTPENGTISCNAYIKNDALHLIVKNSGKGLTKTEIKHIFQRFYQTNSQNQGTGIGLALIKELVHLHKGKIQVESTPNKWTTFSVTIPVDKQSFKNEQFIASQEVVNVTLPLLDQTITVESEKFVHNNQPILLLVEDNDDVRLLLKQTFENTYNILTAANGEIGIELAIENIPDLIISDIMMPIKDGIELTERLKNDERTSHIPIILLTAKAGDNNKLIGLEVGADDYITKPFNSKLLITKAEKLIENRRLLQQRYSQELVLYPKDISVTNIDEQFLEKIQTILDNNLLESSFSVTKFSEAAGMSRMQLHRKLKALTGLTATEFIRSQRLKLAAKLLKTSDINISQVGYSVGFNDHSYFTKCFKDTYKCTPTEYAKRNS